MPEGMPEGMPKGMQRNAGRCREMQEMQMSSCGMARKHLQYRCDSDDSARQGWNLDNIREDLRGSV